MTSLCNNERRTFALVTRYRQYCRQYLFRLEEKQNKKKKNKKKTGMDSNR